MKYRKQRLGFFGVNNPFYGKHHTEETKRKLSEMEKGSGNPFFGRKHTETSKELIKLHHKGNKGKKFSVETRKKLSRASSGSNHHQFGKPLSDAMKRIICGMVFLIAIGFLVRGISAQDNFSLGIKSKNINYQIGEEKESLEITCDEENSPYSLVQIRIEGSKQVITVGSGEDTEGTVKVILVLKEKKEIEGKIKGGSIR